MNTSFYNGVSGVKTDQFYLDTIANNISNINTIGYKRSNAPEFSTVFSANLTNNYFDATANDIGLGVRRTAPTLNMSQGVLQNTDNTFDLAIGGNGWFGVQGPDKSIYYTRAGAFNIDANGDLVDPNGNYLLATNGNNIASTTLPQNIAKDIGKYYSGTNPQTSEPKAISEISDIPLGSTASQKKVNLPTILYYPPTPTTNISYQANLNPQVLTDANGNEIANVEHFSSGIISPTGNKDILDMTFTKRIPQPVSGSTWDGKLKILSFYEKYNPDSNYDPAVYQVDKTAEKVYKIIDSKDATVEFSSTGELINSNIPVMSNSGTPMSINVGTPNTYDGFESSVNFDKSRSEQHDGFEYGLLKNYGVDQEGRVIAEFTNGRSIPVAKIAVYHFQNDQGLEKVDSSLLRESADSGKPIFYTDANQNPMLGAKIYSQKLESSNVDLTVAMSELILAQRTYGASAKSITTSDQMIQNAINMKK